MRQLRDLGLVVLVGLVLIIALVPRVGSNDWLSQTRADTTPQTAVSVRSPAGFAQRPVPLRPSSKR